VALASSHSRTGTGIMIASSARAAKLRWSDVVSSPTATTSSALNAPRWSWCKACDFTTSRLTTGSTAEERRERKDEEQDALPKCGICVVKRIPLHAIIISSSRSYWSSIRTWDDRELRRSTLRDEIARRRNKNYKWKKKGQNFMLTR